MAYFPLSEFSPASVRILLWDISHCQEGSGEELQLQSPIVLSFPFVHWYFPFASFKCCNGPRKEAITRSPPLIIFPHSPFDSLYGPHSLTLLRTSELTVPLSNFIHIDLYLSAQSLTTPFRKSAVLVSCWLRCSPDATNPLFTCVISWSFGLLSSLCLSAFS